MIVARLVLFAAMTAGFATLPGGAACTAAAQGPTGTAGVIIQADGEADREFCVPVGGTSIPALDALRATGVDVVLEDFGADAITICRIDGVGCDHPDEPCFCACADPSAGCTFWGIYSKTPGGEWSFSQLGIGEVDVRAGEVLGLRWTEQTEDGSDPPTSADPDGVCSRVRPVAVAGDAPEEGRDIPWGLVILASVATIVVLSAVRPRRRPGEEP